jgi:hypothetical protein
MNRLATEIPEVFMAFIHTKEVYIEPIINARSGSRVEFGSGPRCLDLDPQHWSILVKEHI